MASDALTAIMTLTATYITVTGLLFVSVPDSLSRHVSRGLPARAIEGALGPVSAGWGPRPALCHHVAGRAGLLCDGPASTAYFDHQHLERSANHSIRDRPGRLFADLSRSGHALGATAAARDARHLFVSGARDSSTGEPALGRCGRSDPLPVPRAPCPRYSSSMWSIRLSRCKRSPMPIAAPSMPSPAWWWPRVSRLRRT